MAKGVKHTEQLTSTLAIISQNLRAITNIFNLQMPRILVYLCSGISATLLDITHISCFLNIYSIFAWFFEIIFKRCWASLKPQSHLSEYGQQTRHDLIHDDHWARSANKFADTPPNLDAVQPCREVPRIFSACTKNSLRGPTPSRVGPHSASGVSSWVH